MFSMEQYNIDNIGSLKMAISYLYYMVQYIFSHSEFREPFIPSFCVTVYKYQGRTISTPYNIYDVGKMDKK